MISVDEISRQVADLCPEDHLKAFLKRDTRPDGRSLEEFRPIIIAPNVLNRFVLRWSIKISKIMRFIAVTVRVWSDWEQQK